MSFLRALSNEVERACRRRGVSGSDQLPDVPVRAENHRAKRARPGVGAPRQSGGHRKQGTVQTVDPGELIYVRATAKTCGRRVWRIARCRFRARFPDGGGARGSAVHARASVVPGECRLRARARGRRAGAQRRRTHSGAGPSPCGGVLSWVIATAAGREMASRDLAEAKVGCGQSVVGALKCYSGGTIYLYNSGGFMVRRLWVAIWPCGLRYPQFSRCYFKLLPGALIL